MTDYAVLRAALEAGPTPGPWTVRYCYVVQATSFDDGRLVPVAQPYGVNSDGTDLFANARMIAACHPEAIRALLAERDAFADVLEAIASIKATPWRAKADALLASVVNLASAALAQGQGGSDAP